jgi:CRP/FNR family transcriptional regulator, dissimilatory nitrate respiration regulator
MVRSSLRAGRYLHLDQNPRVKAEALWNAEGRDRTLEAHEVLFRAGDPVRSLYRVEVGAMRLVRLLPHGAELVLQRAGAGALLAEASVFAAAYYCDAVAVGPTRVRWVLVKRIMGVLERDPGLARAFTHHLAQEVQAARARAEIASMKTVRARLEAWLAVTGGQLPTRGSWRDIA